MTHARHRDEDVHAPTKRIGEEQRRAILIPPSEIRLRTPLWVLAVFTIAPLALIAFGVYWSLR